MVMFILDWEQFKQYNMKQIVYYIEDSKVWDFYAMGTNTEVLRCTIAKSKKAETNIMFVEKELNRPNFMKVMGVDTGGSKIVMQPKFDLPQLDMQRQSTEQVVNLLPESYKVDSNVIRDAKERLSIEDAEGQKVSEQALGGKL